MWNNLLRITLPYVVQQGIPSYTQDKSPTRVGAGAQSYLAYFDIPSLLQFKCQITKLKMLEKSFDGCL